MRSKFISSAEMERTGCSEARENALNDRLAICNGSRAIEAESPCLETRSGGAYIFQIEYTIKCAVH